MREKQDVANFDINIIVIYSNTFGELEMKGKDVAIFVPQSRNNVIYHVEDRRRKILIRDFGGLGRDER